MELTFAHTGPINMIRLMDRLNAEGFPVFAAYQEETQVRVVFSEPVNEQAVRDLFATRDDPSTFTQLEAKARAVWRGEDTFTQAQAQKILAGLVLRHLR